MWWSKLTSRLIIALAKFLGIKSIIWNVAFFDCTVSVCSHGTYPSGKPVEVRSVEDIKKQGDIREIEKRCKPMFGPKIG